MKKLLTFVLVLAMVLSVSSVALALSGSGTKDDPYQVASYADLVADGVNATPAKFINLTDGTIKLEADVRTYGYLVVTGDVVLDLNGKTIGPADSYSPQDDNCNSLIAVKRGATLTIKDSGTGGTITTKKADGSDISGLFAGVQVTIYGEGGTGSDATLVVEGGKIYGSSYGISGNGTRHNTSITINGGEVVGGNLAIYHPQKGTLNVNGGAITGGTGIEMRSGTLNMSGGTVTATDGYVEPAANGNGSTATGVAVAVSQHTTNLPINVSITGGTIKATGADGKALYVTDLEADPNAGAEAPVNVEVKGGEFEGAVEVAKNDAGEPLASLPNGSKIISGGTFSTEPADELVAPNKGVISEEDKFVLVDAISVGGIKIYPAVLDFGTVKVGYAQPAPKAVFIQGIGSRDVTVTVPDEYEICDENGEFIDNSVTIEDSPNNDGITVGIVYIRPKAGLGAGNYTGSVNVSVTNASATLENNNMPALSFAVETPYATGSGISVKYTGGNGFSTSNSAVPTGVEIDNVPVSFTGDGRNFTVSCIKPDAKWVTVRWNSTSVTSNFTPDAAAYCAPTNIPKTGDASLAAFVVMAIVAAAGAMRRK